eukprot:Nk52_evm12s539 gene=Nk52_evmTU12s539
MPKANVEKRCSSISLSMPKWLGGSKGKKYSNVGNDSTEHIRPTNDGGGFDEFRFRAQIQLYMCGESTKNNAMSNDKGGGGGDNGQMGHFIKGNYSDAESPVKAYIRYYNNYNSDNNSNNSSSNAYQDQNQLGDAKKGNNSKKNSNGCTSDPAVIMKVDGFGISLLDPVTEDIIYAFQGDTVKRHHYCSMDDTITIMYSTTGNSNSNLSKSSSGKAQQNANNKQRHRFQNEVNLLPIVFKVDDSKRVDEILTRFVEGYQI